MGKVAFVFPGQGSQSVGMGQDFFTQSPKAQEIYETFNRIVASDLSQVCFQGPEETLKRTLYTQPAILATSLVALELFLERGSLTPVVAAGHSLGEYGALYAAGVVDLPTVATLVKKRAELMENTKDGAMSAVLGLSQPDVERVIEQVQVDYPSQITVANYNTDGQYVISGAPNAIEHAGKLLKEAGAKRVLPLPVGGAFHSPLMKDAADEFAGFIQGFTFSDARFPVITNVDAQATQAGSEMQNKLGLQINHSVHWVQTMKRMVEDFGVTVVVELGPGKVLTGMMKKMHPGVVVYNVFDMASLEATVQAIRETASVS